MTNYVITSKKIEIKAKSDFFYYDTSNTRCFLITKCFVDSKCRGISKCVDSFNVWKNLWVNLFQIKTRRKLLMSRIVRYSSHSHRINNSIQTVCPL